MEIAMKIAEGRMVIGWRDVGRLLESDPESWGEYIDFVHKMTNGHHRAEIADWYVDRLRAEANEKSAGNVGVTLIDVRSEGIEVEYT